MSILPKTRPLGHRVERASSISPTKPVSPRERALGRVKFLLRFLGTYPEQAIAQILADLEASGSVEDCAAIHRGDRLHVAALLAGGYPVVA